MPSDFASGLLPGPGINFETPQKQNPERKTQKGENTEKLQIFEAPRSQLAVRATTNYF